MYVGNAANIDYQRVQALKNKVVDQTKSSIASGGFEELNEIDTELDENAPTKP